MKGSAREGASPIAAAKRDRSQRTKRDARGEALHEARLRAQAIERVICADLTHGLPIDDATAVYVVAMAGQVDRWIERAEAVAA